MMITDVVVTLQAIAMNAKTMTVSDLAATRTRRITRYILGSAMKIDVMASLMAIVDCRLATALITAEAHDMKKERTRDLNGGDEVDTRQLQDDCF